MKFDDVIKRGLNEYSATTTVPAPTKPKVEPKPGETEPKPRHPLKPRPGVKPRPQAKDKKYLDNLSPDVKAFMKTRGM